MEVGSETSYLSELISKVFPKIQIYCIDLEFKRPNLHQSYNNISQLEGESSMVASRFKDLSVDMVYIDADHSYSGVNADLEAWFPKTRKIISGHDYHHPSFPGCTQAINEFLKNKALQIRTGNYYNWWVSL